MVKKCIVMFSGGLDSRLCVKIMQEQGFEVLPVFFRLPFGCGCCNEMGCSFNFSQVQGIELKIFDCTKGKLFQEYMEVLKNPKFGRGTGVNPCRDCKIFMFKKAKEFADENEVDLIVTGEVLNERPMSQTKKALEIIEEESELKGRLLKPLSAKLFDETNAEKKGLVDRSKLYDIQGRQRNRQMELAKKFKIKYPSPAGGCLLCEKFLKRAICPTACLIIFLISAVIFFLRPRFLGGVLSSRRDKTPGLTSLKSTIRLLRKSFFFFLKKPKFADCLSVFSTPKSPSL